VASFGPVLGVPSGGIHLRAKAWSVRGPCVALCALAFGCDSECDETPCGPVGRGPQPGDFVVELDTETADVLFAIDGHESDQGLVAGEFVFTTTDPECVASSNNPCTIVLERLRLELSSATLPTSEGDFELDEPVLSIRAPIELSDSGYGYFLDPGQTGVQTCLSVDGRRDSATVALGDEAGMNIDVPNESFSLNGRFPLRFHAGDDECQTLDATASVSANGRVPWTQRP
jgi:hypothetical protein